MKSPSFDSFTLRAVVWELREKLLGGQVQRIRQPDAWTIIVHVHKYPKTHRLLISANPEQFQAHLTTQVFENPQEPPTFCMALRKYLEGGRISDVQQDGADRVLRIGIASSFGGFELVAELMGRHSNIILLDERGTVVEAVKHVGTAVSHRVVLPGRPYPPLPPSGKPSLWDTPREELEAVWESRPEPLDVKWLMDSFGGMSPQLAESILTAVSPEEALWATVEAASKASPASVSERLDVFYAERSESRQRDRLLQEAKSILDHEAKAINRRLSDLDTVEKNAARADGWRIAGELLSGNAHAIANGETRVSLPNYYDPEMALLDIDLDSTLSARENAESYFTRARKAKAAADRVPVARVEWEEKRTALEAKRAAAENADDGSLAKLVAGWRGAVKAPGSSKGIAEPEYPPGVRIRKYTSEEGWPIWVGENATGNDYLTTKLSDPDDIWLHVRAAASAHGVIRTGRKPDSVPYATLQRAAELVASKSEVKNSGTIPVDYVQRRYVRKPRGAAPGGVTYTREKTIFVGSDGPG